MITKRGWSNYIGIGFVICCVMAAYVYKGNYFDIQPKNLSMEEIKSMPKDLSEMVLKGHLPRILVIKIRGNELSYFYNRDDSNDPRLNVFVNTLIKIISTDLRKDKDRRIPDGDYMITLADGFDDKLPWPIMAFASLRELVDDRYVVLLPDFEALQGYETLFHNVDLASQRYPWPEKVAKVFWRGSATGIDCKDPKDCYTRLTFLQQFKDHDYVDAAFVLIEPNYDRDFLSNTKKIAKIVPFKPFVSIGSSVAYKYLFDIDGNSCTYSRMAWALYSNSVLFKHVSNKIQWYYDKLQANVHYLPINRDFSNLQAQFEWAEANPEQAQEIANNGHQLAKELFNRRSIIDATVEAFVKYKQIADSKMTPEPV